MMMRSPKVLLLSADLAESAEILAALGEHVNLTPVMDPSDLPALIEMEDYDALFCAWSFPRATWSNVMEYVRQFHPALPVIVLAPAPEIREWAEVLGAGAFDLLIPPYEQRTVLAVLEHASASREAFGAREGDGLKMQA